MVEATRERSGNPSKSDHSRSRSASAPDTTIVQTASRHSDSRRKFAPEPGTGSGSSTHRLSTGHDASAAGMAPPGEAKPAAITRLSHSARFISPPRGSERFDARTARPVSPLRPRWPVQRMMTRLPGLRPRPRCPARHTRKRRARKGPASHSFAAVLPAAVATSCGRDHDHGRHHDRDPRPLSR